MVRPANGIRWFGLKVLYFDCFSGASGDMILGALLDSGVALDDLRRALGSLAIDRDAVWTERVIRAGVAATKFHVRGEEGVVERADDHGHSHHDHHHHHHHHGHEHREHHVHRSLTEIGRLIDGSALSPTAKTRAKALFEKLGEAEAAIHGVSVDKVHLHEVGALDSIIDIVGTVHALETLEIEHYVSSPLNVGGGTVRTAHGVYPVPAPATVRLLEGASIYATSRQAELVTPTGALLVTGYARSYGPVPAMRVTNTGYGAGARDFPDTPNVLRILIGESNARDITSASMVAGDLQASGSSGSVVVMEAEIDDMNPQIFGVLMDRLLGDGALDVFYTAIQMKKNRPGTLMTIIAPPEKRDALTSIIFRETTTIGVRYREMSRQCLDRETISVTTPYGAVRIKVARRNGEVLNVSPEFDDCARLAAERNVAVKDVQAVAMKSYLDR